jgi:hypothetical protein
LRLVAAAALAAARDEHEDGQDDRESQENQSHTGDYAAGERVDSATKP